MIEKKICEPSPFFQEDCIDIQELWDGLDNDHRKSILYEVGFFYTNFTEIHSRNPWQALPDVATETIIEELDLINEWFEREKENFDPETIEYIEGL